MAKQKYNPLLKIGFQEVSNGGGGGSQTWADVLALGSSTGPVNPFINDGQKIWFGFNDLIAGHSIEGGAGGDLEINSSGGILMGGSQVEATASTIDLNSTDTNGGRIVLQSGKVSIQSGTQTQTEIELYSTATNKLRLLNLPLSAPQIQTFPDRSGSIYVEDPDIIHVFQATDLPGALQSNTIYVIHGNISTPNTVTVNNDNCAIIGATRDKDSLTYTGTGTFITVTDVNFTFKSIKISAPTGTVFAASNVNPLSPPLYGRTKVITMQDCQFRNCLNGLQISGFDLIDLSNCLFWYFTGSAGNVFASVSKLEISSCEFIRWYDEATATTYSTGNMIELQGLVGVNFGAVNINGCIIHPQQTQSGIFINTNTLTNFGTISSNTFVNTGLTTGNVFSPVIPVVGLPDYSQTYTETYDVFANQGILNSTSGTVNTLVNNVTVTTITTASTPVVINTGGGATLQAAVRYTVAAGGRSTYTGSKQVYVSLHASLTYEKQGGGTDTYNFFFYKNGTLLPGSQTQVVGGTGTSASGAISMIYGTLMNQNDYIEIYVENVGGTNDILIKDYQLVIRE